MSYAITLEAIRAEFAKLKLSPEQVKLGHTLGVTLRTAQLAAQDAADHKAALKEANEYIDRLESELMQTQALMQRINLANQTGEQESLSASLQALNERLRGLDVTVYQAQEARHVLTPLVNRIHAVTLDEGFDYEAEQDTVMTLLIDLAAVLADVPIFYFTKETDHATTADDNGHNTATGGAGPDGAALPGSTGLQPVSQVPQTGAATE